MYRRSKTHKHLVSQSQQSRHLFKTKTRYILNIFEKPVLG